MDRFSQRIGATPPSKALQRECIDEELRNQLWNVLWDYVWQHWKESDRFGYLDPVEKLYRSIWNDYFCFRSDQRPDFSSSFDGDGADTLKRHFFEGEWWQAYDLIEFVVKNLDPAGFGDYRLGRAVKRELNLCIERHNSAYRLVDDEIAEISDRTEIGEIEEAIVSGIPAARSHLQAALEKLSDRKSPDYRNSIKESISAVEAICRALAQKPKATLPDCLKVLRDSEPLHPAFDAALNKLYGYTSDEGGIRHALQDETREPSYAETKFMLVASAAFVNLIVGRAAELNLTLRGDGAV